MKTKILLRKFAKNEKIPVIMETNDKGRIDIERFDLEDLPILYGAFDGLNEADIQAVDSAYLFEKILALFEQTGGLSEKMLASLPLIGKTLQSFPQLASETVSGAAVSAACIRSIFLDESHASGVFFVDLVEIIRHLEQGT